MQDGASGRIRRMKGMEECEFTIFSFGFFCSNAPGKKSRVGGIMDLLNKRLLEPLHIS